MKAYSYYRWSSAAQTKGDSLTRQIKATHDVCKKYGWELDDTLKPDAGLSAYTGSNVKRGSLARFLVAVRGGKIKTPCVLVVERLDRLTRTNLKDARRLFEELLDMGVKICIARDGKVYDETSLENPMDLLMSIIELKAANDFVVNLGEKVSSARTRAKKAARENKIIFTCSTPAWLVANRKTNCFTRVEETVKIAQRIFDSYANGKGVRTIMRELNKEKVPPFGRGKQNRGNGWSSTHLRRTLSNTAVLGEYQPHKYISRHKRVPDGDAIPNFYGEPIVNKATFYKVQELLAANRHTGGCKRNATNLLTGLVKCSKCGGAMVIKRSGMRLGKWSYVSLLCSNAMRGNGCKYNTIQYPQIERAVLTTLWAHVLSGLSIKDERADELIRIQGEHKDKRSHIARIKDALLQSKVHPNAIIEVLNKLEADERGLSSQIESLTARMGEDPLTAWKQIDNTIENRLRVQTLLKERIESLQIDAEKRTATLVLKTPTPPVRAFRLAWKKQENSSFMLDDERQEYLDEALVWKTSKNVKIGKVTIVDDSVEPIQIGTREVEGWKYRSKTMAA